MFELDGSFSVVCPVWAVGARSAATMPFRRSSIRSPTLLRALKSRFGAARVEDATPRKAVGVAKSIRKVSTVRLPSAVRAALGLGASKGTPSPPPTPTDEEQKRSPVKTRARPKPSPAQPAHTKSATSEPTAKKQRLASTQPRQQSATATAPKATSVTPADVSLSLPPPQPQRKPPPQSKPQSMGGPSQRPAPAGTASPRMSPRLAAAAVAMDIPSMTLDDGAASTKAARKAAKKAAKQASKAAGAANAGKVGAPGVSTGTPQAQQLPRSRPTNAPPPQPPKQQQQQPKQQPKQQQPTKPLQPTKQQLQPTKPQQQKQQKQQQMSPKQPSPKQPLSPRQAPLSPRLQPQGGTAFAKAKALRCDRCDGPHASDVCPHFRKSRDAHPDAQRGAGGGLGSLGGNVPLRLRRGRVVPQPGDGSCLFHSLRFGLARHSGSGGGGSGGGGGGGGGGVPSTGQLRQRLAQWVAANANGKIAGTPLHKWVRWDSNLSPQQYAQRMSRSGWGGGIEMAACAHLWRVNVWVYESRGGGSFERISCFDAPATGNGASGNGASGNGASGASNGSPAPTVHILYRGGVHYDALVPDQAELQQALAANAAEERRRRQKQQGGQQQQQQRPHQQEQHAMHDRKRMRGGGPGGGKRKRW